MKQRINKNFILKIVSGAPFIIYYIKLKSRPSVRIFSVEWISAVGARIDVKFARNEAPVIWGDEVYF